MKQKFWAGLVKAAKFSRPFFFELVIIITGIMLSLWLNDRREDAETRKDEKQTLQQVLEDLKTDSAKAATNLKSVKEYTDLSMRLIQMKTDSIKAAFPGIYSEVRSVIVYVSFDPAKVSYMELSEQGKSGKVADKKLVMDIMRLHEESYKTIGRLTDAHRDYLLNKIYPFITQKMPYFGTKKDITEEKITAFANAMQADEFRHMLFFDIVLKQNLQDAYAEVYEEQKLLIEAINKKLAN